MTNVMGDKSITSRLFLLFQNCNCNNSNAKMSLGNCQLSTVTPGIDDMNMCPCHCPCHLVPMSFAIMLHFANMFAKSVICYLLFAPQKNRFQKLLYCYIVTLVTQK